MRVLVFGSTGQLGRELIRSKWPSGTELISLDRRAADLARPESLASIVDAHAPDAVIIAAAYTAVDKAEAEEELATRINGEAPGAIAAAAARRDIPVVHVSTDYVFDGEKHSPYVETDAPRPVSAYGRSKLAGEEAVRCANPRHLIFRTSWVYSAHGSNFLRTMLRLAETRDEVAVVADQHGSPTAAGDIAAALASVVPKLSDPAAPTGTFHIAGSTATTWHGFAEAIFLQLARRGLRRPLNRAIPSSEYPTPARRPRNSRLDCSKFAEAFGDHLPGYQFAVAPVLDELLGPVEARGAA